MTLDIRDRLPRSVKVCVILCTCFLVIATLSVYILREETPRTITLRTQPIPYLPPHGHEIGTDSLGDEGHHVGTQSSIFITPRDVWVTGMSAKLQGAPALTLHHGTIFQMDQQDLECPTEGPRPLVSISQDQMHTPSVAFEPGYGIFIPKGTPLMLDAMFHNPEPPVGPGELYEDVSLELTLTTPAEGTETLRPLTYHLLRLSDTPCREYSHTFVVPPHSDAYVFAGTDEPNDASRFVAPTEGRVVYWGAHLHGWEGGTTLTVFKNGEPAEVFQTIHSEDDAYRFDTPHTAPSLTLQPGDTLSIEAQYTNHTGSPLRGAMGHLGLYIAQ